MAAGTDFCLALNNQGEVVSWGERTSALGLGKLDRSQPYPVQLFFKKDAESVNERVVYISSGSNFAAAVTEKGNLYMWGDNNYGQVAYYEKECYYPSLIEMKGIPVKLVSCGLYHTACIVEYYRVFCWGSNIHGQIGIGEYGGTHSVPKEVRSLRGQCCNMIVCGLDNTMAFNEVGKVFGWGNNSYYKMGMEQANLRYEAILTGKNHLEPTEFIFNLSKYGKPNEFIKFARLEKNYTLGHSTFDRIFIWGLSPEVDINEIDKTRATIEPIIYFGAKLLKDPQLPNSELHESILGKEEDYGKRPNNNERVEKFDRDQNKKEEGQFALRHANGVPITVPITLEESGDTDLDTEGRRAFIKVQGGEDFTMALTYFGELVVWGSNLRGQHGTLAESVLKIYKEFFTTGVVYKEDQWYTLECFPHFIPYFGIEKNRKVTNFACGSKHVVVIENGKTCYTWGDNSFGQLGLGSVKIDRISVPTLVMSVSGMQLKDCCASMDASFILTKQGHVYSCGINREGQLGQGIQDCFGISHDMERIPGFTNVIQMSAGANHVVAIVESDRMEANIFDFLSTLETTNSKKSKDTPDKLTELFCWGNGTLGQLGHKKLESGCYPNKIDIKGDFLSVSAGWSHSAAITIEGRLFLWGYGPKLPREFVRTAASNSPGSIVNHPTEGVIIYEPLEFKKKSTATNTQVVFRQISLGHNYNLATSNDGTMFEWGTFRCDKDNSDVKRFDVEELSNFTGSYVFASSDHAGGINLRGTAIFTWGLDNYSGRLGHMAGVTNSARREQEKVKEAASNKLSKEQKYDGTKISYNPQEVSVLYPLLRQRVDYIHTPVQKIEEREDRETKDKQSISKSNINTNTNTENTVDASMMENSVMSTTESKRAQKIKADQLLSDEYLNYLQGKAQQAFLGMLNLISQFNEALETRLQKLSQLKNTFFCRLIEEPFKLPMRDPSSIFRDDFVYSNFNMNIVENMLTAFQLHPCQLVNLIQAGIVDPSRAVMSPKEFTDFVWQIFGAINCDHRKESLYVKLVEQVLNLELGDEKSSEKVAFFEGDDFQSMNETDGNKTSIQYTNELVNRAIMQSHERVLQISEIYQKIYGDINLKTKSIIDSSQRPYAFVMWEEGGLKSRYSAESGSTWKIDEFTERINTLSKFISTNGEFMKDPILQQKSLTTSLLNKMHSIFANNLKDYREKEKYRILCGYLLLPLGKKIESEVNRMDNSTKERMKLNLKHAWLFMMHFYSGIKVTLSEETNKDSDKWIPKLNDVIFNAHEATVRDIRSSMKGILNNKDRGYDNIMVNIDNDVEMNSPKHRSRNESKEDETEKDNYKPDESQIGVFKNFIFYITQIFDLTQDKISVQKNLLHKVMRTCLDYIPMGEKVPPVELFFDVTN